MAMNEAQFQSMFTRHLRQYADESAAYELKISKTNRLPFSAVKEHQEVALLRAKHGTLVHKISDMGIGYKPFDCFTLCGSAAYVVVMFYKQKARRVCYLIDIDDWMSFKKTHTRKSLTEQDARGLGKEITL